jgi:sigma-B regulation protein RsbU (phosphoserine phosphatase)
MAGKRTELEHDLVARLLDVARHLSASADLTQILSAIIDAMRDLLGAERATVFEYDRSSNELFTTVAHGVGADTEVSEGIRIPATAGIAGECAQKRAIINVPDAYADPRFNQAVDRKTGFRTQSILAIPLVDFDGELIGVAQVLNRVSGGAFGADEERIAEALASHAAVAIKRGRLIEDRVLREKLQRDLQVARTIQQSTFPSAWPGVPGFDVFACSEPADETGGDAYDVIGVSADGAIINPSSKAKDAHADRLLMLLADATGHGIGPALSVTQVRSMLRMAARLGASLSEIAAHLNHQLCADLPGGRFITAWLGEIDAMTGTLAMLSAGQGPLLLYRAASDSFESIDPDVLPFGIMEDVEFPQPTCITLAPGDIFIAASDGFYEAMDPQDKLFGTQRVEAAIRAAAGKSSAEVAIALRDAVIEFAQSSARADDQTIVVVKRMK